MSYFEHNGLKLSRGNLKSGKDTLIFNMGSATDCPSLKLGYCKLGKKCYAYKAENMYPQVKPYRDKQASYWKECFSSDFIVDFRNILKKHPKALKGIKYLRLNESGDFYSQACIEKLSLIAQGLFRNHSIITYTYTAREDLNFIDVYFLVKGSSNNAGNNGKCIARPTSKLIPGSNIYYEKGKQYELCVGDCRECYLCKRKNNINIVFEIH